MKRTKTPLHLEHLAEALNRRGRQLRLAEMDALEEGQPRDYKLIPLLHRKFARVDNEDFDYLNQFLWYSNNGYASRRDNATQGMIWMHRVIMKCPEGMEVDHIDGNRWDNRRANLRLCTDVQNQGNRWKSKHAKTSKYKGVYFCKRDKIFAAYGRHGARNIRLGSFKKEDDAARAYDGWAIKYFGEFARLNFGPRRSEVFQ